MRQVLTVTSIVSKNKYNAKDKTGKTHIIDTDRSLRVGQSALLVNGVVVGIVKSESFPVYVV